MGLLKGFKKTLKRSLTVKGLVNNAKNLSGVGLLQRSKTARKIALAGVAVAGAVYAAPYAAAAGKAALAGGKLVGGKLLGSLAQKLYTPPVNGMNATAAENTAPDNTDLVQTLYGPEYANDGVGARRAVGITAASSVPASCASVGGSADEWGFLIAMAVLVAVCAVPYFRSLWSTRHRAYNSSKSAS